MPRSASSNSLTRDEILDRNPALRGEFNSGLYCGRDAAVESRAALGALRTYMENSRRYEFLPGHELAGVADHAAIDHRGVHYGGDHVVLCLGATLSGFGAELFERRPLAQGPSLHGRDRTTRRHVDDVGRQR